MLVIDGLAVLGDPCGLFLPRLGWDATSCCGCQHPIIQGVVVGGGKMQVVAGQKFDHCEQRGAFVAVAEAVSIDKRIE